MLCHAPSLPKAAALSLASAAGLQGAQGPQQHDTAVETKADEVQRGLGVGGPRPVGDPAQLPLPSFPPPCSSAAPDSSSALLLSSEVSWLRDWRLRLALTSPSLCGDLALQLALAAAVSQQPCREGG